MALKTVTKGRGQGGTKPLRKILDLPRRSKITISLNHFSMPRLPEKSYKRSHEKTRSRKINLKHAVQKQSCVSIMSLISLTDDANTTEGAT